MNDFNPCLKPMANPAVVRRKVATDQVVLVNLDNGASVALNLTGDLIWQLSDGRRTLEKIVAAVHNYFPDAPPDIVEDVSSLVSTLAEDGFIGFEWIAMENENSRAE
ncbi:PqqD family peptide modification chaperone [candidate division KSB1 bacterium]|nr:PqqD family peptide modification chaperone [candidate division KSB1 bacterium]